MSFLLEFSMFPTDVGESKSKYVGRIIDMIDKSGLPYKLTPMSTVVEGESMDEILSIIKRSYELLEPDCSRVYSSLKIDIRKGRSQTLTSKIASVEKVVGRKVKS